MWEFGKIGKPSGQFRSFNVQILQARIVGFQVGLNFTSYCKVKNVYFDQNGYDHWNILGILFFACYFQVALAYGDALLSGRLSCTNGGGIIQPTFIESLRKRIEDILTNSDGIQESLSLYLSKEQRPSDAKRTDAVLLAWYLLWYSIPPPGVVSSALKKIPKGKSNDKLSMVPLLRLLLPNTHQKGIIEIEKFRASLGR